MKKLHVIAISSLMIFSLWLIQSCTFDKLPADYATVGICFETEILPIFITNCTGSGCHNSIDKEDGYDLTSYDKIINDIVPYDATKGHIMESIRDSDPDDVMPPPPASPLSAAQITLLEEWINKGAPNTINCQTASCDSVANVSFASEVMPIIQTNCAGGGCHDAGTAAGGYNYSDYAGVKLSVGNRFIKSINHDASVPVMPPSYQIGACDITKLTTWINEGALDN